ncbi:hypothetical protein Anapl_03959 [Anas platyrhynchos]|uniref:Uncharacterized protein n=1 Tax=Anas platyrhynchos TaxID=8839 RepID=R0KEX9_ANAPL|nr:hypothetical protein Anapl_03959 [Anas platyrhynchos]
MKHKLAACAALDHLPHLLKPPDFVEKEGLIRQNAAGAASVTIQEGGEFPHMGGHNAYYAKYQVLLKLNLVEVIDVVKEGSTGSKAEQGSQRRTDTQDIDTAGCTGCHRQDYPEVYRREYAYKFQKEIGKFAVRFQEEF